MSDKEKFTLPLDLGEAQRFTAQAVQSGREKLFLIDPNTELTFLFLRYPAQLSDEQYQVFITDLLAKLTYFFVHKEWVDSWFSTHEPAENAPGKKRFALLKEAWQAAKEENDDGTPVTKPLSFGYFTHVIDGLAEGNITVLAAGHQKEGDIAENILMDLVDNFGSIMGWVSLEKQMFAEEKEQEFGNEARQSYPSFRQKLVKYLQSHDFSAVHPDVHTQFMKALEKIDGILEYQEASSEEKLNLATKPPQPEVFIAKKAA